MTSSRFVATAIPAEPTRRLMDNSQVIGDLKRVVGKRYVLTKPSSTRRFRKGFRFGVGDALAVVRPGSLLEQWRALNICAAAGKIVIVQAANTGLTGGSTPDGNDYDRDVVIISTLRIDRKAVD
jgi:D-lactate dehydrogenase (quinone)